MSYLSDEQHESLALTEVCQNETCERRFYPSESTAREVSRFCSAECEAETAEADDVPPEVDPRVKGDDDGQEYGDPRDEQIDRLLR